MGQLDAGAERRSTPWSEIGRRPIDKHKVVSVITLEELDKMLTQGLKKSPKYGVAESGFALGHGGILAEVLRSRQAKQLIGEIMTTY